MLNHKVAVVTGGGRGIGKEIALKLGGLGARLAINYLKNADEAAAVAAQLIQSGAEAKTFQADVSSSVACDAMIEHIYREFGSIDLLASNAGIEHFAPLEEISKVDVMNVFGTNVFGQLFITKAACEYMKNGSRIVLTSSISAQLGIFHHTLYAASKAAVSAMVKNLAPELGARGICINAIAPGGNRDIHGDVCRCAIRPPAVARFGRSTNSD